MDNRIGFLIARSGYTQKEFAEMSGITQSYISKICNGHSIPTLDKAYAIAKALGVSLDDLVIQDIVDRNEPQDNVNLTKEEELYIKKIRSLSQENRTAVYSVIDTFFSLEKGTETLSDSPENNAS